MVRIQAGEPLNFELAAANAGFARVSFRLELIYSVVSVALLVTDRGVGPNFRDYDFSLRVQVTPLRRYRCGYHISRSVGRNQPTRGG